MVNSESRAGETGGSLAPGRLVAVLLIGPVALLAGMYGVSLAVDVVFGDVIFAATAVVAAGWLLLTGSRRRTMGMAATSPMGALLGVDEEYAREMSDGTLKEYAQPSVLLVMLTAAVAIGWLVVAVQWTA